MKTILQKKIVNTAGIDLAEHYVNVSVIAPGDMYKGRDLNPALKDRFAERGFARIKLLSLAVDHNDWRFDGGAAQNVDIYTQEWKRGFRHFIQKMTAHLSKHGYSYDSYAVYPYDEYIGEKFIYVAKLIREIDPHIKIYANSVGEGIHDVRKVSALVDVWCPPLNKVINNKPLLDEIKRNCSQVWCYETFSRNRLVNPTSELDNCFHRTLPIKAVSIGLAGAGFWVYSIDTSKGRFNDCIALNWNVVYDGSQNPDKECFPETIVPSKRWQQWREGVEDAVCLMEHEELLHEFARKSLDNITSEYLYSLRRQAD